jgi:hypothetical protein
LISMSIIGEVRRVCVLYNVGWNSRWTHWTSFVDNHLFSWSKVILPDGPSRACMSRNL